MSTNDQDSSCFCHSKGSGIESIYIPVLLYARGLKPGALEEEAGRAFQLSPSDYVRNMFSRHSERHNSYRRSFTHTELAGSSSQTPRPPSQSCHRPILPEQLKMCTSGHQGSFGRKLLSVSRMRPTMPAFVFFPKYPSWTPWHSHSVEWRACCFAHARPRCSTGLRPAMYHSCSRETANKTSELHMQTPSPEASLSEVRGASTARNQTYLHQGSTPVPVRPTVPIRDRSL